MKPSSSYNPLSPSKNHPKDGSGAILLDDSPPPRRKSLDEESEGSDIVVYRDNLDVEPFDEKDKRFSDSGRTEYAAEDDDEEGYVVEPRRLRPRKKSRKVLAALIAIVSFAAVVGALSALSYSAPSYALGNGNRQITMDHIFNGTFAPHLKSIAWVKGAPDGTISQIDSISGNILLSHVSNMTANRTLVESSKVLDVDGKPVRWTSWELSADGLYILFKTDTVKQWRYSSHSNFYIHHIASSATFPIRPPSFPPTVAIAKWAPVGHAIAYVDKNDLYVVSESEVTSRKPASVRVTTDGSPTVFNGVPDWVYEEEVYQGDTSTWWSLDGRSLAYIRLDETAVHEWKMMYYNPTNDAFHVDQYPTEVDIRYPKPGTPNPLASVHTFSLDALEFTGSALLAKTELSWAGAMPLDERLIKEVAWVSNDQLLVREVDRAGRKGTVQIFDKAGKSKTVRTLGKNGEQGDDGWIDPGQWVKAVGSPVNGYVDIVPKDGFNHIALFAPANSTKPTWLTQGDLFEVREISSVNASSGTVHCLIATTGIGSAESRLLSVPIHGSAAPVALPTTVELLNLRPGKSVKVSFSPGGRYYLENNMGPDVPTQRIVEVGVNDGLDVLLEDNKALNATLGEFVRPIISRSEFTTPDGIKLNMMELLPPNMDTSGRKKYPVLFNVYGGPAAQMVDSKYFADWRNYLAATKKYIVVLVDGRGTGWKGRKLRNVVMDNLGHWEVIDQIAAAKDMAKRPYVDREKIGIMGWSYGGYMTCKTLEANSGVFKLGMAIAPVTDWNYYDSIYTERYMNTPQANPEGYKQAGVRNVTNFQGVDFLLGHGTGDDNVHFQNSASLIDKLTQEHIRGWRFRMFTDSNHGMDKREGNREVYQWMVDFLDEKWGRGGTTRHG